MIQTLRGQLDNARLLMEAFQVSATVTEHFGAPRITAFRQAVRCTLATRMRPQEALDFGMLAPGGGSPEDVLSKRECSRLQQRQNAQDWFFVAEDKSVFQQFCVAAGIPVPHCHALLFRGAYGMVGELPVAPSPDAWSEVLETLDLTDTVIKPCRSSYGHGVLILGNSDGVLTSGKHRFESAAAVAQFMYDEPAHRSWLVQQRIHSHPALDALAGTTYLQTARIYTYIGDDGVASVVAAFLKIIGADAVIDNFEQGALGNFMVPVDVDTGELQDAIGRRPGYRWERLREHPCTGHAFREFRIPQWQHMLAVTRAAAERFRPLRSLSWDVAITESGPVVVETNIRWDPPNWHPATIRHLRPFIDPSVQPRWSRHRKGA